jgi:outer membrane protein TolC
MVRGARGRERRNVSGAAGARRNERAAAGVYLAMNHLLPHPSRVRLGALALAVIASLAVASVDVRAQQPAARGDTLRLTLADAVERALRASDEVHVSEAQAEVAEAQLGVARASALPQLRLNTTYSRAFRNARAQAVGQLFNQPNTYNANLNLSQSLFQGGRIVAGIRAASSVRAASRLSGEDVRAVVTVDAQRAYLDALLAERLVAIQTQNLALSTERLQQVEQFQQAGRAARYDVLRARVERANLEPQLIQVRNARDLALLELKRLLNVPVEQPIALSTAIDAGMTERVLASLTDTSAAVARASLRAAELTVEARRAGVRVARADALPTLSISYQNGYQAFPPPGMGFPSRFGAAAEEFCTGTPTAGRLCQNGGWFSDRSLNLTVSWPVFDGFRARSSVDLAQAQQRLAEVELTRERESVAIEVARGRAELARARAVFAASRQTVAEADEAFRLATLRFARGLSTQLEVTDAQLALATAQTGEARATYDVYLAAAELARALGRPIPMADGAQVDPTRSSDRR